MLAMATGCKERRLGVPGKRKLASVGQAYMPAGYIFFAMQILKYPKFFLTERFIKEIGLQDSDESRKPF